MKKYIKINKEQTEKEAVKHLESLWGKVLDNLMKVIWDKIIILDENNYIYYASYSEQYLKQKWYEEIILTPNFEWYILLYLMKTKNWRYIVEDNNWILWAFKNIVKIPKETTIETITIWENKYNKQEFEEAIKKLKILND